MIGNWDNTYTLGHYKKDPKYMKLVRWVSEHQNEEFSKTRLFFESGYTDPSLPYNYFKENRGQNSCTLRALHYYGIISYNKSTKTWTAGPNLDKYLG